MKKIQKMGLALTIAALSVQTVPTAVFADPGTAIVAASIVAPQQIVAERVFQYAPIDLTDNITGLAPEAKLKVLSAPETKELGDFEAEVQVTLQDKTETVKVPVHVVSDPDVTPLKTTVGTDPEVNNGVKTQAGDVVKILQAADVSKIGNTFVKVQVTRGGDTKIHYIPVTVEKAPEKDKKTESDLFDRAKLPKKIEIKKGEKLNVEKYYEGIIPATAKLTVEDTWKQHNVGTHTLPVKIVFADNSRIDTEITLVVAEDAKKDDYRNYKIPSSDIKAEEIELDDRIDLTDNIKNLPSGSKVKEINVPRIRETGTFYGDVEVTFPDGTVQKVQVKIVVSSRYDKHRVKSSDIIDEEIFVGDKIDLTDNIKNLPNRTKVEVESTPNNDKAGTFYGKVRIVFPDGTTQKAEVRVVIKEKAATWTPNATNILREEIQVGQAIDVTNNVLGLPSGAFVRPVSVPATNIPGEFVAKAEVVFDGKVIPIDIPVSIKGSAIPDETGFTPTQASETQTVNQLGEEPVKGEVVKTSDESFSSPLKFAGFGSVIALLGFVLSRKKH